MQSDNHGASSEFYRAAAHMTPAERMSEEEVREELKVVRTRLMLASAFVDFLRYAYSQLLHHGVNYLTTPAYSDHTLLDDAAKLPLTRGADRYVTWLGRVRSDISAAVARKGLRAVFSRKTPPPATTPTKPPKGV